jgi:uroporphyrinogen decarboxylase
MRSLDAQPRHSARKPLFDRVLSALYRQEPDQVPIAEVWVDPEVKAAFLGHPVLSLRDDVSFWVSAGYDFIALDTDLYAAPQVQQSIVNPHSNTAIQYQDHRQDRNWVDSKASVIKNREDVEAFPWPTADSLDYSMYEEVETYLPQDMKVVVTFGHIFTMAWQLMGFEHFCVSLLDDLALVEDIMQRIGDESMLLLEKVLRYPCVGAMCIQDDIAYTNGLMVSPGLLRRIFFPWLRQSAEICHAAGRPLIFHSDGLLDQVMTDIIAAGVDALHPIEPKCMDIAAVKQAYGDRLALVGNLDLGYTLTRGTPQEVREEVRYLIKNVAPGGGYLLGSANSVTNYVPLENYRAMLEAAFDYGRYPIQL